jgi:hypothetical protein
LIINTSAQMLLSEHEAIRALTPAQQRFADENRACLVPGSFAEEGVVRFYRVGPMLTRRWLVDDDGNVIEFDVFARTA